LENYIVIFVANEVLYVSTVVIKVVKF